MIKYNPGPARKSGNSFKLTKKLLDQNKESNPMETKHKTGTFKGERVKVYFLVFTILNPQKTRPITTNNSNINSLIGKNISMQ